MTERFNFFDIYVYLLPGLLALLVLAAPFWMIAGWAPPHDVPLAQDISGVAAALVVAYIVGHLLYILAERGLPSRVSLVDHAQVPAKRDTYPSERQPDLYPTPIQERLRNEVRARFGLDIYDPDPAVRDAARKTAFFLSRSFIRHHNGAAYTEQFQGLYNFTRQASMACALGAFTFAGWGVGRAAGDILASAMAWATPAALLVGFVFWWRESWNARRITIPSGKKKPHMSRRPMTRTMVALAERAKRCLEWAPVLQRPFWYCTGALFISAGFNCSNAVLPRASSAWPPSSQPAWWLAPGCALVLFTLAVALRRAHLQFTWGFASAVYNDFLAITSASQSDAEPPVHPRDMVQIQEGKPLSVPTGKLLVLTGLGMNDYSGEAQLLINGVLEVSNRSSPAGGSEPLSVVQLPTGFTAASGSQVEVRSTGAEASRKGARAWGYFRSQ